MSAKTKAPAFTARAVSSCLSRAGLKRRHRVKGCRAWFGDFYVGDVAPWTLPADAPRTIEVAITNPVGGGMLARQRNQERAALALAAAGYVLGRNDPREGEHGIGRIWLVAPAPDALASMPDWDDPNQPDHVADLMAEVKP